MVLGGMKKLFGPAKITSFDQIPFLVGIKELHDDSLSLLNLSPQKRVLASLPSRVHHHRDDHLRFDVGHGYNLED